MADPLTILGTAGSVATIIGVLGKTISAVSELKSEWKDADIAVITFEMQLITLKAAFTKIKEWTDTNFEDPHHQLVMDLDRCMAHCRLLVDTIDTELASFQTSGDSQLDVASKFRLLFKTKGINNLQKMIKQLTSALTLLLTACNR